MSWDAMSDAPSLLIVEDDDALRERLRRAFRERGFDVQAAGTIGEAQALAEAEPPELAVIDLRVGDESGLALIPVLHALDPETRMVILTGYGSVATAVEAVRRGAVHYLTKPADADEILAALQGDGRTESPPDWQPMSLDRVQWEHINRVLMDCGGNISEAARVLGLHRRSLQRKLAKYPSAR
jgi:two-component system response regulator RegA